jgi:hypothetical protein
MKPDEGRGDFTSADNSSSVPSLYSETLKVLAGGAMGTATRAFGMNDGKR